MIILGHYSIPSLTYQTSPPEGMVLGLGFRGVGFRVSG